MDPNSSRNIDSISTRRQRSSRSLSPRPHSHSHEKRVRDRDNRRHHRHREGSHRAFDYEDDDDHSDQKEARSRHYSHHHNHHHHRRRGSDHGRRIEASPVSAAPRVLPYNARQLSKHDLSRMEPIFAMYLDIQKGLILGDLNEREVKGRWKSFVKRWNNGELAEGWYDPRTFEKAVSGFEGTGDDYSRAGEREPLPTRVSDTRSDKHDDRSDSPRGKSPPERNEEHDNVADEDDEDEIYGPTLPNQVTAYRNPPSGPTIPKLQDLEVQREMAQEEAQTARSTALLQHQEELRRHKDQIRTAQEEVAPRAEPGTHERKMEKRRAAAAANREFAAGRRGGSPTMDAAPDSELMGGGDGDLEALKKAKEQEQRKKNEREIRREEIARARRMEREERLAEYKKKEEETMSWLKALAKQRFG